MDSHAPSVMLIEKDEVTMEIYRRELSKSFTVLTFTDIPGVLEALADRTIRAVIIEPEISSGQGWELINSLDAVFPDRLIPVIVCSTRDSNPQLKGKNVTLYLTKPVLPRTLREKTLAVLGL